MPHLIVEYSSNLSEHIDIADLLRALHQSALETGIFPIGGLRTRGVAREHYIIADEYPDNAFIHLVLRIGHGRDAETKQRAGEHVFSTLCAYLDELFQTAPLSISAELQEIDPVLSFKHNNLHEIVKKRAQ